MARSGGIIGTVAGALRVEAVAAANPRRAEIDLIAAGVERVAGQIASVTRPGFLYFAATTQYLAERLAAAVCHEHGVPVDRADDVAVYLTAAMQEFAVSLLAEFDVAHFDAWIAAQEQAEG